MAAADLSAKVHSFNGNRNDGLVVDLTSLRIAKIKSVFSHIFHPLEMLLSKHFF